MTGFQGINDLDADPSGRHLLFSVSGVADTPSLFSVSEGAPPQEICPPHADVAW